MRFRMDQLLGSLSFGFDAVESELAGSTSNHGKRVAVLVAAMGRYLGLGDASLIGVTACGLLHDNALTEALAEHRQEGGPSRLLADHCIKGEANASFLPFPESVKDILKYHHEYMDGSGPFGVPGDKTPLGAQLIALADHFDIHCKVKEQPESGLEKLREAVKSKQGRYYSPLAAEAMLGALDNGLLRSLKDPAVDAAFARAVPPWAVSPDAEGMMKIAKTIAAITDYKSKFTAEHSARIADRAHGMARFYGYSGDDAAKVYFAAALHDIGKLVTPVEVLEKPGKLSDGEFAVIKEHVYWSYIMLKDVEGLEQICRWAVCHHRKLSGGGYPELPREYLELDFESRLLACIDIYQAVREARPYHPERTHAETISIMRKMAVNGEIDANITEDMDKVFGGLSI